jgi:hypothetical protein
MFQNMSTKPLYYDNAVSTEINETLSKPFIYQNGLIFALLAKNHKTLIEAWVNFPMDLSKNISQVEV